MTPKEELRLLIPVAEENGLVEAVALLESLIGPQCLRWERRETWFRCTKKFRSTMSAKVCKAAIRDMRRWCHDNASNDFSWHVVTPRHVLVAFECERDVVAFSVAFDAVRSQWKDPHQPFRADRWWFRARAKNK